MFEYVVDNHVVDFARLSTDVLEKLATYKISHMLRNEVDARLGAEKEKRSEAGTPMTEEEITEFRDNLRSVRLQALYDGKIEAPSTRGPRLDPLQKLVNELALDGVLKVLASKGVDAKTAKGKGWSQAISTPDGVVSYTLDALVKRRLNPDIQAGRVPTKDRAGNVLPVSEWPTYADHYAKEAAKILKAREKVNSVNPDESL